MRRTLLGRTAVALLLVAALAGCSDQSSASSVADQGYVSGDGTVRTLPVAERDRPLRFSGRTLDGASFDVREHRGEVVVVNVWGSWCPPCIAEAPELQSTWESLQGEGVTFVGINVKDNEAAALAHERRFGVTYPSIRDDAGRLLVSMRGTLPPQAVPSTLVLDRRGRVAARVLGQLPKGALADLVEDVLAEPRS